MNRVEACRTMDERSEKRPHAPIAGLDAPFDELPSPVSGRRARSAADTLRYVEADPFADTMAVPDSAASERLARPDWCVDLPSSLMTMSTFELWAAIEQGRVTPTVRVWREGLECWTRVDDLPELGWALPVTPAPPAETAPAATPVSFAPPEAAPPHRDEPSPASAPVPMAAKPRRAPGNGRWIALGSAVAAASLAASLLVVSFRAPVPPPAPLAFAGAAPPAETLPTPRAPGEANAVSPPDPAPERRDEATRHDERGQRRLPRGGRSAYGR
jgi:hypothetical protein